MSTARATRRRGVSDASQYAVGREARDPARRIVVAVRERVEREVHAFGRDDARARNEQRAVLGREAEPHELRRCGERRARDRTGEQQQADRVAELVRVEPERVHERLAALGRDPVLAEPVLDRLLVVADLAQ